MTDLQQYILEHAERGECTCGKCVDSVPSPENSQPKGHVSDLIFFKVSNRGGRGDRMVLKNLIIANFPQWLDGKEHSYLEIGGNLGDQSLALMVMGLGRLTGLWNLLTPKSMGMPEELWNTMTGMGMITIQVITPPKSKL